eukprot:182183_1
MTIPRLSTQQALDFLHFMDRIFVHDQSSKYRIVTDMERYEKKNENDDDSEFIRDEKAGAILVHLLREKGYYNEICIFTGRGHVKHAIKACAELGCTDNVIATDNATECYKFCLNRVDSEPISMIGFTDENKQLDEKLEEKWDVKWNDIGNKNDNEKKSNEVRGNVKITKILKEGWLKKKSKYVGSWRERWVVINMNEDMINIFTFKRKKEYRNPTETIFIRG